MKKFHKKIGAPARPTARELIGEVELLCAHVGYTTDKGESVPCNAAAVLVQHGFLCHRHTAIVFPKKAPTHKVIRGEAQPITAEQILDADIAAARADDLDLRMLRTKTLIGLDIDVLAELLGADPAEEN